ncbi:hypothetical protein [Actinomadura spongiicola]|nr:hypothetical protein [Actinomadura spongiicola]
MREEFVEDAYGWDGRGIDATVAVDDAEQIMQSLVGRLCIV